MIPYQIIRVKRDGGQLDRNELTEFLQAYAMGELPDYQMSAFLMAVYYNGLSSAELHVMVETMLRSGVVLDLSNVAGAKLDKHSTGGVGDKVSIILAPLAAALGIKVPMMSGRGLGHTGGTVDKLESIPGMRMELSLAEFERQVATIGCALITQTSDIAPLDKKLYALRDVSATVESIPLIASSIMCKKIAEGIDGLLLDVKRGNGAFMPDLERGLRLARTMIAIGEEYGVRTVALMTAMDRPLGCAVGNALEIEESIQTLRGEGPADLRALTVAQCAEMLMLAGDRNRLRALKAAEAALDDGRALDKFRQIVEAQGGNPNVVDDPALLPQTEVRHVVTARTTGMLLTMDVRAIGEAAVRLGAGRAALDSVIDPAVGFHITAKPGDVLEKDQPIATVFARTTDQAEGAAQALLEAITVGEGKADLLPLISHRVTVRGVEEIA